MKSAEPSDLKLYEMKRPDDCPAVIVVSVDGDMCKQLTSHVIDVVAGRAVGLTALNIRLHKPRP